MTISKRRKYVTRAGEPVRILCTDGPDPAGPIIGLLSGRKGPSQWTAEGKHGRHQLQPCTSDLIPYTIWNKGECRYEALWDGGPKFRLFKGVDY